MTSKDLQLVALATVAFAAIASAACAQDAPTAGAGADPATSSGLLNLPGLQGLPGLQDIPGILTPHTTVGVSVEELYDNNIARTDAATALVRGLVREDYVTTPHVVIDVASNLAGINVFALGTAGYDYHANNKQLNRQNTDLKGGADVRFGRCSAALIGDYAAHQTDQRDLYSGVQRSQGTLKSVEVDVGCARPSGLSPKISVSQSWTTNSAALQSIADTNVTSVTPTLSYARPALGVVSLFGRYDDIVYPNRVDLNGKTAGFDGLAGGVDLAKQVTPKLSANVNVSYVQLTPRQTAQTRFSGVNYDASFAYTPTSRTSLNLEIGRSVKPSVRIDSNFTVADFMSLSGKLKLGYRTTVELGVDQRRESFATNNLAVFTTLSSDTLSEVYAAVNFRVNRRVLLTLDAREQKRDANPSTFAYTDWRAGLTAAVTY